MTKTASSRSAPTVDEQAVLDYLADHPDLFLRRPEALAGLTLRHDCGDAASLIEYQVRILREENTTLRRRMDEIVRVARHNDGTAERLHELTLELLATDDLQAGVESLRAGLREGFHADAVGMLLVAPQSNARPAGDPIPEIVPADDAALEHFRDILDRGRPSCGTPTDAQRRVLFPDTEQTIHSAALVPMVDDRCIGLLGIGSQDADRYHAGQGTVFLRRLGAIAARVLDRLLRQR